MGCPKGVPESKVSRSTLAVGLSLLTLVACAERRRDVVSTLQGRCAGVWAVAPEHAMRALAWDPPRDRLVISLTELWPLGESLVPGKSYARGTIAFGDKATDCSLEFRTRRGGDAGSYVRYISPTAAPFGIGGDGCGFYLDLMTDGDRRQDWLMVDFRRDDEPRPNGETWLRYLREP